MSTKFFKELPNRSSPWFSDKIEVRRSSIHGLGVFAKDLIKKDEIFESCPVIVFNQFTMKHLFDLKNSTHILHDYVFSWYKGEVAVALGYGSIYNHSNDISNASHRMNNEAPSIQFVAKRDIHPDEEILIHYWKGMIRGEFTDAGTMVSDSRITEKNKRDGIVRYKKKRKK